MLTRLNALRWYARWPIKSTLFGLACLIVCFPYPNRLVKHVVHWSDPNRLVEPDAPALQPLVAELRASLDENLPPKEMLRRVERFVYQKIPYDWDWNTWGTADYLPSVDETLRAGREDCDGRAVIAASLLQALDVDAEIVTDFMHVWVKTERGETMGPGKTKAVVATDKGLRVNARGLLGIPRALAYGVAVFPLVRELILVGVLWVLLIRRRAGWLGYAASLAVLVVGLLVLRFGGVDYRAPRVLPQLVGLALILGGAWWAVVAGRRKERCECGGSSEQSRTTDGVV